MIIFLSYSWTHIDETNHLDELLEQFNVEVIRDVRHLKELENIKVFIDKILEADFAILMINDAYLKSKNCMYEIIKLMEDKSFQKRAIPILFEDVIISNAQTRIGYMQYWENQLAQLQNDIKNSLTSFANSSNVIKELEQFQLIRNNINEFFNFITDHLCFTYKKEVQENYSGLFNHLSLVKRKMSENTNYKSRPTIDRIEIPNSNGANHIVDIYRLLLNLSNNSELELPRLLGHLQEIANNLSSYFTTTTKSECAVSFKLIQNDGSKEQTVATLIRDTKSQSRFTALNNFKTRIFDNTNYAHVFYQIKKGKAIFFSNNLAHLKEYSNTEFALFGMPTTTSVKDREKYWTLPYKSIITAPILNSATNNETTILGFLNIDSPKTDVFNSEYDLKLVSDIAEQLFFSLQRLHATTYANESEVI